MIRKRKRKRGLTRAQLMRRRLLRAFAAVLLISAAVFLCCSGLKKLLSLKQENQAETETSAAAGTGSSDAENSDPGSSGAGNSGPGSPGPGGTESGNTETAAAPYENPEAETKTAEGPGAQDSERWPALDTEDFTVPEDHTGLTDCGYSIDSASYSDTGGTAQGTLSIDTSVPDGCIPLGDLSIEDPIVDTPDRYSYEILEEDIEALKCAYPDLFYAVSLGPTPDGRSFCCLTIGNRKAEHHILITASIHAREYITTNLVMKQAEYLMYAAEAGGCFDGRSIRDWLDDFCITILPMCNPDGTAISQGGLSALADESLKEKVREAWRNDTGNSGNDVPDSWLVRWKANADGVNLNENFTALWSRLKDNSGKISSSSFKGESPCSEPETRYMTQIADSKHYLAALHYHAMGNILYWDIANNKMREHSRGLANNISALTGYPKKISDDGGSFKDYCQLKEDPCASVTIEVGSTEAPVNPKEMPSIWAKNYLVPFYAMKWALEEGLK